MNPGLWMAIVGVVWLMLSVVLGLVLGPVIRRRDEESPLVYQDSVVSGHTLSYRAPVEVALEQLGDLGHRWPDPGHRRLDIDEVEAASRP